MSAVENLPANNEAVELIAAIKTPAVLTGNFDQVRSHFVEQLKAYDLVVTSDTLADAKKLCTELNKMATEVKGRGKAVSSEASAPINAFNEQVKELAQLLLDARTKLKDQCDAFENETRAKALEVLHAYLIEQCTAKGIQPEFQRATVDDLANLSTLTGTGKLTAKYKAEVDNRIQADLNLQTQTEMRLLKLENESYKAGLAAPLERRHVEPFLFAAEPEYQQQLTSLLQAEAERETKARAAADERAARESKMKAEAEERAARAEADRKEAERIRAEQQAKHNAEMEALKAQQAQQLAEQQAQMQRAPQPAVVPISMDSPAIKHAIGELANPAGAVMHVVTFAEACRIAADTATSQQTAIWTKESGKYPAAIILTGDAVKAYLGA
jgi:hypothetical protein